MSKIRTLAIAGAILLAATHLGGSAGATVNPEILQSDDDFSIAISPPTIEFDLVPGQVSEQTIRVRNLGTAETDLHIGIAPLEIEDEEYSIDSRQDTPRTEITRWSSVSLEPGCSSTSTNSDGSLLVHFRTREECFVRFAVDTPANAPYGSQHMTVYFEEQTPDGAEGIQMVRSLGANVYAANTTGGGGACGNLLAQHIPFWLLDGPIETSVRVENCGALDFHTKVKIEVRSLLGALVYEQAEPTDRIVMAETTRAILDSWETPSIGIYKLKQTVEILGETYTTEQVVFLIPLWLILIIFICLLAAILATVASHRKKPKTQRRIR